MAEIHIQDELPNSAANQTPYTDEDEISLIDIMAVLWKFRALIGIITGGVTLFILLFTFIAAKIPGEKSSVLDYEFLQSCDGDYNLQEMKFHIFMDKDSNPKSSLKQLPEH